jgi:hypothetical protein
MSVIPRYAALRKQVHQTLLVGQKEIERAKVQTYWRTGKIINDHIRRHQANDAHYGGEVVERLAKDLDVSARVLWHCVQFARSFKILTARSESSAMPLSWTHYRELLSVPDEKQRLAFAKRARESEWTYRELVNKIKLEVKPPSPSPLPQRGEGQRILRPRRGALYTYRLILPESKHNKEDAGPVWMDLGFHVHRALPDSARGLKPGSIVESVKNAAGRYQARPSQRTSSVWSTATR